jgi:dihydroneopterin aldolase
MTPPGRIQPIPQPVPRTTRRRLLIRNLELRCAIGAYAHERGKRQRVRIDVELEMAEPDAAHHDRLSAVVSYDEIAEGIRRVVHEGHVNLVETLAERIADLCLADARVAAATVRLEKLDVLPDAAGAGVEIERRFRE